MKSILLLATLSPLLLAVSCTMPKSNSQNQLSSLGGADCIFDAADPFEPRSRLAKGEHAGECFDTRTSRPLVRLTAEQARAYGGSASDVLSVANVTHRGKFHVAHIPVNSLKAAIFQLEYFPAAVPAGHTQLRLQFDEKRPVTLVSQSKAGIPTVSRVTDLVMSVEALAQPGFKYDIFKGMKDQYGAVFRMTSLEEKFDHMITKQNHRVEQWKLNISHTELVKILDSYVSTSQKNALKLMYHTVKFNCTTEIVEAIDAGMDYSLREKFGKFTAHTTDFYPNVIRISLIKRGLLPAGKANDLAELKDDPVASTFK